MADFIERGQAMQNDPATVNRIRAMSQATGYHPTYIAAWLDVENAETPEERANRAAMMSRAPGDAFEQYAGNSQRQYETGQQMENSRLNREHQTGERVAGQKFKRNERIAGEEFTVDNREKTLTGQRKNNNRQERRRRQGEDIDRNAKQDAQIQQNQFTTKRDKKQHKNRMEEIDATKGTGPTAYKRAIENKDELLAGDPSGIRIDSMIRQERELNPQASDEEIREKLKLELRSNHADYFHNPESPIAESGHVPPGLVQEMSTILGPKTTFEEFCDYVGLDENDARTSQWFTEITGLEPNHDHWLPDWMTGG